MCRSLHSSDLIVEIGVGVDGDIGISSSYFLQFVPVNLNIQTVTVDIDRELSFVFGCSPVPVLR